MFISSSTAVVAAEQNNSYAETLNQQHSIDFENAPYGLNTGDIFSPAPSIEEQLSDLSSTQKSMVMEKLFDETNTVLSTPFSISWKYLDGFEMHKQEEDYYCVVASCKATIQYLTGSSDNQTDIAWDLGTTFMGTPFSDAKTYLNDKQTVTTYVIRDADTPLSTMQTSFYLSIFKYNTPPLISVAFNSKNGWPYTVSGHTACISGARSDQLYFQVADPYIQWVKPDASMYYTQTSGRIHTAISDRGNGYMY